MLIKIKPNLVKSSSLILLMIALIIGLVVPLQAGNKSIVKVGSDVHIEADMRVDDAVAIGGSLIVDGIIDGDAVAVGGKIHLSEEAVVHGDVITVGGSVEQAEGALIYGSTVDVSSIDLESVFENMDFTPRFHHIPRGLKFIPVIGLIALALFFAAIMPKELNKVATIAKNEPGIMFLWGLLGVILVLPLALMLIISIIGIALIPLEILAVFLAFLIGYIAVSIILGRRILKALKNNDPNLILSALIGILVLWLVGLIPFFGGLVKGVASMIGFGAVIVAVVRRNKKEEELIIEES